MNYLSTIYMSFRSLSLSKRKHSLTFLSLNRFISTSSMTEEIFFSLKSFSLFGYELQFVRLRTTVCSAKNYSSHIGELKQTHRLRFLLALSFFFLLPSCNFLDVNPDSKYDINIDKEEKIAELITGAYPRASYASFLEARTDNVGERMHGEHFRLNEAMYFWEDYDQEDLDTPLHYWNACYQGIAQVNKALELLKTYDKTPRVKALYGEAFLLRAYLHFMLVNIWAEPYRGANTSDLGIPYLMKPEKNALVDYKRGTVAEVYNKIEEDLKLGITLVDDSYYQSPKFHFNKKAAYAFASRFYLYKGEWSLVVKYANYVLGYDIAPLLRSWQKYERDYRFNNKQLYRSYVAKTESANLMLLTTESRIKRDLPIQKFAPTFRVVDEIFNKQGLMSSGPLKKLNLRTTYRFTKSPTPITNGWYIAKFDEHSMILDNTSLRPKDLYVTNVLFTTDEVLLNRMEAYAMLHNYDKSLADMVLYLQTKYNITIPDRELLLSTSANNYSLYTPFYGLTIKQLALVKIITELRQKEFYEEGLRWFDIRRFYLPVSRKSSNPLYTPLRKEDPRKLLQIPAEAINRGLEANPRVEKGSAHWSN